MSSRRSEALGTHDTFDGPDGLLSYYRTGSGNPLVLLHSLALSAQLWTSVVADFAVAHDVIALDLRGHGGSSWSKQDFTIEDLTDDVLALLDHLDLPAADILGLSMGGSLALTLAGVAPKRVRRLVVCDTTAWYGPDAHTAWEKRATEAASRLRHLQVTFQVDRWYSEAFRRHHPEIVSIATGLFLATSPALHAASCRALGALDSRGRLGSITAPTLVVCGKDDQATTPEMAESIVAGVKEATLVVAPGKHFAIFESEQLRRTITGYLAGETIAMSNPEAFLEECCQHSKGTSA